jgi:hypothetical protein
MKKAFLATVALPLAMLTTGCGEMPERPVNRLDKQKAETLELLQREYGMNVKEITIPKEMYDLPKGAYEVTIQTSEGKKDCIANVVKTTHGHTNVILNCN